MKVFIADSEAASAAEYCSLVIGMINSSELNYRNNVPFNAQTVPLSQSGQPVAVPSMQGVQDTYVANRAKKIEYGWAGLPIGVAAWLGICKGMDYFNNKLCSKDYMETPFGKIGAWGDKMSDSYFNSSFAKSETGKSVHSFFGRVKTFINDKVIGKSKLLTAMKTTPTRPENKLVIPQAKGLFGLHNMEIDSLIPSFLEESEVPKQLERYGVKEAAVKDLEKALKGKSKADIKALLQAEEFKIFGVSDVDALKAAKIKALGFESVEQYERIAKDFLAHPEEVMNALKKANPNMFINRCVGEGTLGKLQKLLFERKVTFKELANKYMVTNFSPHKTKLGRGLAKSLGWFMEGMTNRFAGGKFIAIMQAAMLAEAAVATLKADGLKDKAQTFIERNVNNFSYVYAAPLAIMAMHSVGGMKYAGMTPEQVALYRENLEVFNTSAKNGFFKNKAEYKAAKKELQKALNADVKNPITKIGKWIGRFINVGNEKIGPYISKESHNLNFMRKSGYWLKNAAGYPLRFGLAMFVLMPFVSGFTTKISNFIFGKPKNSVLDEGNEEANEKGNKNANENVNAQLARLRQEQMLRQQASVQHRQLANQALNNSPRMDMLTRYKQAQNGRTVINNNTTTNIYGSQEEPNKNNEPLRTYIPSPVGVQVVGPNIDPVNDAMQKSINAEQEALRILGMK